MGISTIYSEVVPSPKLGTSFLNPSLRGRGKQRGTTLGFVVSAESLIARLPISDVSEGTILASLPTAMHSRTIARGETY